MNVSGFFGGLASLSKRRRGAAFRVGGVSCIGLPISTTSRRNRSWCCRKRCKCAALVALAAFARVAPWIGRRRVGLLEIVAF